MVQLRLQSTACFCSSKPCEALVIEHQRQEPFLNLTGIVTARKRLHCTKQIIHMFSPGWSRKEMGCRSSVVAYPGGPGAFAALAIMSYMRRLRRVVFNSACAASSSSRSSSVMWTLTFGNVKSSLSSLGVKAACQYRPHWFRASYQGSPFAQNVATLGLWRTCSRCCRLCCIVLAKADE